MDEPEIGTTGHTLDRRGVNHPKHYNKHPSGVEANRVMVFMPSNLSQGFKYVFRRGEKIEPGKTALESLVKDLDKALWYLNDELTMVPAYMPLPLWGEYPDRLMNRIIEHEPDEDARSFYEGVQEYCKALIQGRKSTFVLKYMILAVEALKVHATTS